MQWFEEINGYINALKPVTLNKSTAQNMLRFIDFTRLNETDTTANMIAFCDKAKTQEGRVAAVCVYPKFVKLAAKMLADTPIRIASVANFPGGMAACESVLMEIHHAIQDGAGEIDVVFPYSRYISSERQEARDFVAACKAACGLQITLKVILETGAMRDQSMIAAASVDALESGADFIKTSTGKIEAGATLEAAATMLLAIKHLLPTQKRLMGLKVSGGIKDPQLALHYFALAGNVMGSEWVTPDTFRIGASQLVDEICRYSESLISL